MEARNVSSLMCEEKRLQSYFLFLAVSLSSCSSSVLASWHLIYQAGSRLSIKTLWSETTHCVPDMESLPEWKETKDLFSRFIT